MGKIFFASSWLIISALELPGVFRRILLRLLRAVIAADGDLPAADLHFDSIILDLPVAHRAFLRLIHSISFRVIFIGTRTNAIVASAIACVSCGDRIAGGEKSDFQILAHFAERSATRVAAHLGWSSAELTAEGIGEVAMAGKAEFDGELSKIVRAIGESFERSAEAQTGQIAMYRHTGSLLEDSCQVEWRSVYGASDVIERDAFKEAACKIGFGRLGSIRVIGFSAFPPALARHSLLRERGFEHAGDKLKRRLINPERIGPKLIGPIAARAFQPQHQLIVPPKNAGIARARDEGERPFGTVVDGRIEFADDVVEHAR
jgi:hypothetical protein